jgi:hypothetical protein
VFREGKLHPNKTKTLQNRKRVFKFLRMYEDWAGLSLIPEIANLFIIIIDIQFKLWDPAYAGTN